jgi:hypothetical protein
MSELFTDNDNKLLGPVRYVDTRKIEIHVANDKDLIKARVSQLVYLRMSGATEEWLIGMIDRVVRTPDINNEITDEEQVKPPTEGVWNSVGVTLLGMIWFVKEDKTDRKQYYFSRSLARVPEINCPCYALTGEELKKFMGIVVDTTKSPYSLILGKYTIDNDADAFLDGNKLFQRHAAVLGSTGSGKSWTVASILEKAARLPSANLIVFDLHSEYSILDYARHLRIPGPEDIGSSNPELLYLPYWLLNGEELQALFIDKTEFSAHNQVMVFQEAVLEEKK